MADTQVIKDRVDIVQLIQEYLPLKKAGANWKAPCPFHNEKSPSFMVHQEKQIWHCFGCGKGGDIFSFIQEIEGLDFPEALKLLAGKAGVKLETFAHSAVESSLRNRLLSINQAAAYFFHRFLLELPASQAAREYLEKRGLKIETITAWSIGFVADQWDLLTKYLLKKGFAIDDLVASGLTIKREGAPAGQGYYDRFRGRIMFPIADVHGGVVGFTGRVLVETERSGGKYVNTPQTAVYDKSRVLYGLHQAKTAIKTADQAIIVEGQMDVISCHQAGMKNVVAASGTALTPEQVKLIKRYSNNLAISFDADAAGLAADKRGIDNALAAGLSVKVIQLAPSIGKDAAEVLQSNPKAWFQAVKEAQEVMSWYFATTLPADALSLSPSERRQMAAVLLSRIGAISYPIERDYWLKELGKRLDIEPAVLREELKRIIAGTGPSFKHSPNHSFAPKQPTSVAEKSAPDRFSLLIESLWSLIVKYPESYGGISNELKASYFLASPFLALYEVWQKQYTSADLKKASFAPEIQATINRLLLRADQQFPDHDAAAALSEIRLFTAQIKNEWLKRERKRLSFALSEAERKKDTEAIEKIVNELQALI